MKGLALQMGDFELKKIDRVELDKYLGGVINLWPNDPPADPNPSPPQEAPMILLRVPRIQLMQPQLVPGFGVPPAPGGAPPFQPLLPRNGDPNIL